MLQATEPPNRRGSDDVSLRAIFTPVPEAVDDVDVMAVVPTTRDAVRRHVDTAGSDPILILEADISQLGPDCARESNSLSSLRDVIHVPMRHRCVLAHHAANVAVCGDAHVAFAVPGRPGVRTLMLRVANVRRHGSIGRADAPPDLAVDFRIEGEFNATVHNPHPHVEVVADVRNARRERLAVDDDGPLLGRRGEFHVDNRLAESHQHVAHDPRRSRAHECQDVAIHQTNAAAGLGHRGLESVDDLFGISGLPKHTGCIGDRGGPAVICGVGPEIVPAGNARTFARIHGLRGRRLPKRDPEEQRKGGNDRFH
ncbi:MAG: hypothetical protein JWL75_565 [Parcubacteria group bacterium]|nr:hypothetical protein [Parcubacteria group bacterium]